MMSVGGSALGDESPYEIPQSRGVPPVVGWFFAIGVMLIFFMGGISAFESDSFKVWPAHNTVKIPLSGSFER